MYAIRHVIVVDTNGGGNFSTVQGAIDMVPEHNTQRVKIYILPGTYREKIYIPITKPYILFIGQMNHTSRTILTWHDLASDKNQYGIALGTYNSASVTVESDYFCATRITFENSAVPVRRGQGNQAVALRIAGDKAMFYKVRFLGKQDTLLDESGTHFFYKCFIQGRVDFVFGRARSLYKECHLNSIAKRSGAIAAHHRDSPDDLSNVFIHFPVGKQG
ncbi:pectinesterase QRT1-like [Ziziphus jujuba]|uniref:pectinesterase n=1 Tax=Ziziphus jujuba TaxID=326968 RepID=A0ABM4A9L0_ZIZJJ|nr:pectinesterase QRT1-like [Ziziphus jujuba]